MAEQKNIKTVKACSAVYIIAVLLAFAVILILPQSREWFKSASGSHPFLMGFAKFALLATAGELIAAFLAKGSFTLPVKLLWRFIIWGLIGVWITFMMKVYGAAVAALMAGGTLPGGSNAFLRALYTSVIMNTTFGPTFMAVHKCTDKLLALRAQKQPAGLKAVVTGIDWSTFASFTIAKTVPFFWVPAHTVTFLLPAEYQVIMAAALSVALGVILTLANTVKGGTKR